MKLLSIKLEDELHKQLKLLAVNEQYQASLPNL